MGGCISSDAESYDESYDESYGESYGKPYVIPCHRPKESFERGIRKQGTCKLLNAVTTVKCMAILAEDDRRMMDWCEQNARPHPPKDMLLRDAWQRCVELSRERDREVALYMELNLHDADLSPMQKHYMNELIWRVAVWKATFAELM